MRNSVKSGSVRVRFNCITDKRNVLQFEYRGANYDVDGKMRNWWTKESWKHFLEKQKCFVDYFDKYEIGGFKVEP